MKDKSTSPESRGPRIVQVALPLPLTGTFSYSVPRKTSLPLPGSRVLVPFGRQRHIGFVVEDPDAVPPEKVRDLGMVLDSQPLLAPEILQLTRWTSDYYQASWGLTLQCAHPPDLTLFPGEG